MKRPGSVVEPGHWSSLLSPLAEAETEQLLAEEYEQFASQISQLQDLRKQMTQIVDALPPRPLERAELLELLLSQPIARVVSSNMKSSRFMFSSIIASQRWWVPDRGAPI